MMKDLTLSPENQEQGEDTLVTSIQHTLEVKVIKIKQGREKKKATKL